jgi:hypothetical protein
MSTLAVLAFSFALAGCSVSHADNGPAAYDHAAIVGVHMHQHYDMLGAIQHLVIHDDLYDVRAIAQSIADAPDEPGLKSWPAQSALVRARAKDLATAPNNDEACRRTAQLVAACARCHVDANVVPMFGSPPPLPTAGPTVRERMARHVWAGDRLFEGMVGAVNDPWLAGLDVLATSPAPWAVADPGRAPLARRLQELAQQTRSRFAKGDLAARAGAYSEILVTCAGCHAADRTAAK